MVAVGQAVAGLAGGGTAALDEAFRYEAVSLRARFGFPRVAHDVRSRLVIVREHARTVGLIVDSAREFATIAAESIKPLPEGIGGTSGRYLRGIAQQGERLLLIVDVHELLETDEQPTDTVPAEAGTIM